MAEQTTNYGLTLPGENDFYNVGDFNGNMEKIDTELKTAQDKADQAFQSASNGKTAIKAAITGVDPDVTIPTDATFTQLAAAIGQIKTGVDTEDATVIAEQILAGMTAYVKGVKVTGTMTNRGAINITPGTANQAIPQGYHNGSGVVAGDPDLVTGNIKAGVNIYGVAGKSSVIDTADATIIDGTQLINGYTAYKNGSKIIGSMATQSPDYADQIPCLTQTVGAGSGDGLNYAYMQIPNARFYTGAINWVRHLEPDLVPQNILSGKSIFGVSGGATTGKRSASGTTTSNSGGTYFDGDGTTITAYGIVVSGLTFQPSYIMAFYEYPATGNPYVIFNANGVGLDSYGIKILAGFSQVRLATKQISGFKLQGAAYVNATGFNMPTLTGGLVYHWTAIE
jgi:hypothetical protein